MKLRVVAAGSVVMFLFLSCHPLVNPVDPRSTTYLGTPTEGGNGEETDEPDPVLPAATEWQIVAFHSPGVAHPLEITEDGSFIETRDPGSFELWITLADSFVADDATGAILWVALSNSATGDGYGYLSVDEVNPDQRRLVWTIPTGNFPTRTRARLRLVDRNGATLGERVVGYLIGDVDGDGVVEPGAGVDEDFGIMQSLDGFAPSTSNEMAIRADLDLNGVVETAASDWARAVPGVDLPDRPPDFWPED